MSEVRQTADRVGIIREGRLVTVERVERLRERAVRKVEKNERIGYLPEESYLYRFLNAEETLDFYGRLFDIDPDTRRRRSRGKPRMKPLR